MKKAFLTALIAAFTLFTATPSFASAEFEYQVDYFETTGGGSNFSDDFNDGVPNPAWFPIFGTVIEAGGVVTLTNPGFVMPLPGYPSITMERSDLFLYYPMKYNGLGDFVGESTWVPILPEGPGGFYCMGSDNKVDDLNREYLMIGVANLSNIVARNLIGQGASGGLQILKLRLSYEYSGSEYGGGLFVEAEQYPFDPEDVTGNIVLRLAFTDATDEFLASFSLDGGSTFLTPFAPMVSSLPYGGNWMLSADPMEPTACDDGLDNDGDGYIDWNGGPLGEPADPGCGEATDESEKSPTLICDDGIDNDGDGKIDYPEDPNCANPWWKSEAPWVNPCGIGAELALLLPPLMWMWRRRK